MIEDLEKPYNKESYSNKLSCRFYRKVDEIKENISTWWTLKYYDSYRWIVRVGCVIGYKVEQKLDGVNGKNLFMKINNKILSWILRR